ncbi:MAG: nucleotide exchange factor GrpE [Nanoarchaeota archaeon]|nr:nucleotide exchange factor GrpE [Nanoarchaeota archaeon]
MKKEKQAKHQEHKNQEKTETEKNEDLTEVTAVLDELEKYDDLTHSSSSDDKIKDLTNDLQRLQAEFENYKKRSEKENRKVSLLGKMELIKSILPVLDTFEVALKSANELSNKSPNNNCISHNSNNSGFELINAQLLKILNSEGLSEIKTKCKFNPEIHEAVMQQKSEDFADEEIVEVLQKGYEFNGFVIRPAKVKINLCPEKNDA